MMKINLPLEGWIQLETAVKVRLHGEKQSTLEYQPGKYAVPGGKIATYEQIIDWAAERDIEVRI